MKKRNGSSSSGSNSTQKKIIVPDYNPAYDDVYSLVFCNFSALERKAQVCTFNRHTNGNAVRLEHINFILQASSRSLVGNTCPCCHKHRATYFRIKDGRPVICCEKCKSKCGVETYPLSFETFKHPDFQFPEGQKQLRQVFKSTFNLSDHPEPMMIYDILKKNYLLAQD
ncbi:MAG: hypothetical protein WC456_01295 [Patescibacteria group bacterium]